MESQENKPEPSLIYNAMRTPDGTILVSRHRHDFQTHIDKITKRQYMIDGGLDYLRRSCNGDEEDLSLFDTEPHEVQRQAIAWGTYGKNGDQPFKYIHIAGMSDTHILLVLSECRPRDVIKNCMKKEIELRNQKVLDSIPD